MESVALNLSHFRVENLNERFHKAISLYHIISKKMRRVVEVQALKISRATST